jgi:hypothetical protein
MNLPDTNIISFPVSPDHALPFFSTIHNMELALELVLHPAWLSAHPLTPMHAKNSIGLQMLNSWIHMKLAAGG